VTKPKKPCAILLPTSLEVKALAKRTGKGTRKAYFWLLAEKQKGQTLPLFPEGAV